MIMAGGSGTRLWPLSRQGEPKQLLDLFDGKSLLRLAYERVSTMIPDERIVVCTGAAYADRVQEILPELPSENLLGEPEGRDSLNAVAWSSAVLAHHDPDAVVAVLSADHIIEPVDAFQASLTEAFEVAEADSDALVTFGVVPTEPHTGYGYLHRGDDVDGFTHTSQVVEFKEKPSRELAEQYVASGRYWWNSGMFVWRATTLLEQLRQLMPDTHRQVTKLAEHPELLAEIYPTLTKISVDYAIMEPVSAGRASAHVVAVALPITWHDVGSFPTLAALMPHDEAGNAIRGSVVVRDAAANLLVNDTQGVLAVMGVDDVAVVVTDDAILVTALGATANMKELVADVKQAHGASYA